MHAKQRINPRFSLRAFARALGVNPGSLTQILQGRRFFSAKSAHRMFASLALDADGQTAFLRSLAEVKKKSGLRRIDRGLRAYLPEARPALELDEDVFRTIADWYHYAILELANVESFSEDPAWIAEELAIPVSVAETALDRLVRLGLLVVDERGRLQRRHDRMVTANPAATSAAHRLRQEQILERSTHSLRTVPIELRNHTAMTLAIDPARLPEAKAMVSRFMDELTDFLDTGKKKCVYEIALQVFPLQRPEGIARERDSR